jgi:hypothetical protein
MLERSEFEQIIVEPFRSLWSDYVARYRPTDVPQAPRQHFAGDSRLTPSQARLRWMLPVMYPSYVDDRDVFVKTASGWHSLAGLDEAMLDHLRALDPACEKHVEAVTPTGPCIEIAWQVADACLRGNAERFKHACQLAATQCPR